MWGTVGRFAETYFLPPGVSVIDAGNAIYHAAQDFSGRLAEKKQERIDAQAKAEEAKAEELKAEEQAKAEEAKAEELKAEEQAKAEELKAEELKAEEAKAELEELNSFDGTDQEAVSEENTLEDMNSFDNTDHETETPEESNTQDEIIEQDLNDGLGF